MRETKDNSFFIFRHNVEYNTHRLLIGDGGPMNSDDTPGDLLVLTKSGLARIKQDWHYHLATAAGRPRCGALLNLHEWRLLTVVEPPANLCGRCARLINPKARRIHITSSRSDTEESEAQLGLPLDEDDVIDDRETKDGDDRL